MTRTNHNCTAFRGTNEWCSRCILQAHAKLNLNPAYNIAEEPIVTPALVRDCQRSRALCQRRAGAGRILHEDLPCGSSSMYGVFAWGIAVSTDRLTTSHARWKLHNPKTGCPTLKQLHACLTTPHPRLCLRDAITTSRHQHHATMHVFRRATARGFSQPAGLGRADGLTGQLRLLAEHAQQLRGFSLA